MLVEQFLRVLITAVRTSKVGVLFLALAVLIVFVLVVLGIASLVGDLLFMASARVPMIHFLGTGWGILVAAASAVVFALLGIGILWFLKSHVPQTEAPQAENPAPPSPPLPKPDEIEELRTNLRQVEQERDQARQEVDALRERFGDERGAVHWGQANAVNLTELAANAEAKRKIEELEATSERLGEELRQAREELEVSKSGERRKRIEKWRAEIRTHDFQRHPLGTSWFAETETYLEMRPHLPPKIRERFESQAAAALTFLGPAHLRGREGDRRVLLGEVAR